MNNVVPFTRKTTKNNNFIQMPECEDRLSEVLSEAFLNSHDLLGYPESGFYGQYVEVYTHTSYGSLLLLDLDVPDFARGTFGIDRATMRLKKILDRPLLHFQ